ncbi:MAG: DUF1045 domain-containing protein [Alphaproteobacteria bacterium]
MSPADAAPRLAVYFAPRPAGALHRFGSGWLGRDAVTGAALPQPPVAGIAPERLAAITASARLYGFHATLKAPFRLAAGCDEQGLIAAATALAADIAPFDAPPLMLATIDGWKALVLAEPCPAMQALCDAMVTGLDPLRAPLSEAEMARRLAGGGLGPRERALLDRWGYPYVLDAFRFHMTLAGRTGDDERALLDAALAPLVAPFAQSALRVDAVTVFRQPQAGAPFGAVARIPLGAAIADS